MFCQPLKPINDLNHVITKTGHVANKMAIIVVVIILRSVQFPGSYFAVDLYKYNQK